MRTSLALGVLAVLTLPACAGSDDGDGEAGRRQPPNSAAAADPGAAGLLRQVPAGVVTDRLIGTRIPQMGEVVTDANNWILYRFDKDSATPPTSACSGQCAAVWPPVLVNGLPQLSGITGEVGTITRPDGGTQVTLGGWPLYRYLGDPRPGGWQGQGVGGVWFVVTPTGTPNKSWLPAGTPTPVAPPGSPGGGGY